MTNPGFTSFTHLDSKYTWTKLFIEIFFDFLLFLNRVKLLELFMGVFIDLVFFSVNILKINC